MPTTAQTFYYSTGAKDFAAAGEVDIRKMVEAAGAENATTYTNHPAAAGTTSITIDPYSITSTQSDIRANLGWAINAAGTDGIASAAQALRVIAAGNWGFVLGAVVPVAGTGTGTLAAYYIVSVYRVSVTGVRTLLFSATSASISSNALQATGNYLAASSTQPEIVLAAGETLHLGYLAVCTQVAGLLGAVVAGNINWLMGSASTYLSVPAPGVRTRYPQGLADSASITDTLKGLTLKVRNLNDSAPISDTLTRKGIYARALSDAAPITDALGRVYQGARALADAAPVTDTLQRVLTANRALADAAPVTDTLTRRYMGNRTLADSAPIAESVTRRVMYARQMLDAVGSGGATIPAGSNVINADRSARLYHLAMLQGLDPANPLVVSSTSRTAGSLVQSVVGTQTVTVSTSSAPVLAGNVDAWIDDLSAIHGLTAPLAVTATSRTAGAVNQAISTADNITTVARQ